jgi:hypothetical protein
LRNGGSDVVSPNESPYDSSVLMRKRHLPGNTMYFVKSTLAT